MNDRQNYLLAAAQLISLYLGYENLIENRAQSAANDVNEANNKQAEFLLNNLTKLFEEQNKLLYSISDKLDLLISLCFQPPSDFLNS